MASIVLPVPARPSSATTLTSGSSSSSSAKRCSLERARRPHASGAACGEQHELVADAAGERRLRAGAQHGELVLADRPAVVDRVATSTAPAAYRQSIDLVRGLERRPAASRRSVGGRSSAGARRRRRPRWAALMRSAASFETIVVRRDRTAWPSAAPMMRLSGTAGSRPCSMSRCFWMPLISICTVPLADRHRLGERAAVLRSRSSSIARSAVRAARPTSSGRVFRLSSSSITVSGMTSATSPNVARQCGSAISTEVSSTTRRSVSLLLTAGAASSLQRSAPAPWRGERVGGEEIGHGHLSGLGRPMGPDRVVGSSQQRGQLYPTSSVAWWMPGRTGRPDVAARRRRRRAAC